MGGVAPAAYVELTGRGAWVAIPTEIEESGGTPVPGSKGGGPVGAGGEELEDVVAPPTGSDALVDVVAPVDEVAVDDPDGDARSCRFCAR